VLASEVIDRTYREWLYPAGIEQPTFDVLSTAIDEDPTTLTLSLDGRVENVPNDSVIEIDSELMLNKETSGSSVTLLSRGYLDTDIVAHDEGSRVVIDPNFPRASVLKAVQSIVGQLYPWGLYATGLLTSNTFAHNEMQELPEAAEDILRVFVRKTTDVEDWDELRNWKLFPDWDPVRYKLFGGYGDGQALRITWIGDFTLPSAEDIDLDDCGVPTTLQPNLPFGVAATLIQGLELTKLQVDEIRNLLASEGIQAGATFNIGQTMLQSFKREYVMAERRRQSMKHPPEIKVVRR
jgi:hypothetical protein